MTRTKYNGPFSLVREWSSPIRNIYFSRELGILEITIEGKAMITSEILDQMKKSGFTLQSISNSIGIDYLDVPEFLKDFVDIHDEDDVPQFIWTTMTFKDYQRPSLENGGKTDSEIKSIDNQKGNSAEQKESSVNLC